MRAPTMLSVLVLCCLAGSPAIAEERWELLREKDGVRLSKLVTDRGLPVTRAETEIRAGLFEILAVLADTPRRVEWMSRCTESRKLAGSEDGGSTISYTRNQGNWPAADRDSVVRAEVSVSPAGDSARIELEAVESPLAPEVDGVVRIPVLTGEYRLRALGPGRTRVDHRISVDLGGRVPGFIERFVREDMPFDTVRALRRQAERTVSEYRDEAHALREQRLGTGGPPVTTR